MASGSRAFTIEDKRANITEAMLTGPEAHFPQKDVAKFEDPDNADSSRLRRQYDVERAVEGETNEFRRILKLRNWINRQWPIDNDQNFNGDAFAILEKAKAGAGFHCAHCMVVQRAVLTALGFVARNLGVDRDHRDLGRSVHHGVNEVWSNDYAKWVLVDAKYDIHFERDGVPLSALDVHEAVRGADSGRGVVMVQGVERRPVPMDDPRRIEATIRSYWWVAFHTHRNAFARADWPQDDAKMVVYDNAAFRENTWFRQNRSNLVKHWAYAADAFIRTSDRHEIEWTPGVPRLRARQTDDAQIAVEAASATPGLREYRYRIGDGSWQASAEGRISWPLSSGENVLAVRTINSLGVEGPPVIVRIRFA